MGAVTGSLFWIWETSLFVGYHSEAIPSSLDLLRGLICHPGGPY